MKWIHFCLYIIILTSGIMQSFISNGLKDSLSKRKSSKKVSIHFECIGYNSPVHQSEQQIYLFAEYPRKPTPKTVLEK